MDRSGTGTPWAWLLAATPAVSAAAIEPVMLGFFRAAEQPPGLPVPDDVAHLITTGFAVNLVASVLLVALGGLLAWFDRRSLARRDAPRLFPWGWGVVPLVYLIGRSVTLRRRTGRGAGPLVLWSILFAAGVLALLAQFAVVVVTVLRSGQLSS